MSKVSKKAKPLPTGYLAHLLADRSTQLREFCRSFGIQLFLKNRLSERIDFLRTVEIREDDGLQDITIEIDGTKVILCDTSGRYRNLHVICVQDGDDTHTIVEDFRYNQGHDNRVWSFARGTIVGLSPAFDDPYQTRALVNLIVHVSNVLGFWGITKAPYVTQSR